MYKLRSTLKGAVSKDILEFFLFLYSNAPWPFYIFRKFNSALLDSALAFDLQGTLLTFKLHFRPPSRTFDLQIKLLTSKSNFWPSNHTFDLLQWVRIPSRTEVAVGSTSGQDSSSPSWHAFADLSSSDLGASSTVLSSLRWRSIFLRPAVDISSISFDTRRLG